MELVQNRLIPVSKQRYKNKEKEFKNKLLKHLEQKYINKIKIIKNGSNNFNKQQKGIYKLSISQKKLVKQIDKPLIREMINDSIRSHNTDIIADIFQKNIKLSEILRLISEYKSIHPEKNIPTLFHIIACRSMDFSEKSPRSRGNKLIRTNSFSLDYIKINFNFCEKLEKKMSELLLDEEFKTIPISKAKKTILLYKYILGICKLNITALKQNFTIPMRNFNFLNIILETPINEIQESIIPYLDNKLAEISLFKTNSSSVSGATAMKKVINNCNK